MLPKSEEEIGFVLVIIAFLSAVELKKTHGSSMAQFLQRPCTFLTLWSAVSGPSPPVINPALETCSYVSELNSLYACSLLLAQCPHTDTQNGIMKKGPEVNRVSLTAPLTPFPAPTCLARWFIGLERERDRERGTLWAACVCRIQPAAPEEPD